MLIGIAGWRVWRRGDTSALRVWGLQMVLNLSWTPVFFGLHQIGAALVVILALLAVVLAFIALNLRRDRVAALLFVPYAGWVGFAALLNAAIWRLNG